MEEKKSWYKRSWGMAILFVAALFILLSALFTRQVYVYYAQLKQGIKPDLSVGRRFSGTLNMTPKPTSIDTQAIMLRVSGKGDDPYSGPESAEHEIVEFVDFDCPYCKSSVPTVHEVMRERPDVKFIVRDFPLTEIHPDAESAAKAARCVWRQGNSNVYWKFHDLLFANQNSHDLDSLKQLASQAGADSRYDTCMASLQVTPAIQQSISDATAMGVSVTPTFFVDGKMVEGAADVQTLVNLLQ
ncbi:MAG: thioredoxin domain-containing protein [Patescibacteria group bacterium]|jgi:protein-disulfide isomerase